MKFLPKATYLLVFLAAILLFLYHLSSLLVPLTLGVYLAMLIVPFTRFLERYKAHKILSSLISAFTLFILSGLFFYMLFYQITLFAEEMDLIEEQLTSAVERVQQEITSITGMTLEEQNEVVNTETLLKFIEDSIAGVVGGILIFTGNFLLVFAYVFLILLYRDKFFDFIISLYPTHKEKENTRDALKEISKVIFHYLWGRLQVMLALAIMYIAAFLIFGLPYALLITLFGALITIIPYIGPLVSGIVPITFALIFFDEFSYILIFSTCIVIIQLIESYVFEPFFLSREVKLNALVVVISVLLGGYIWGIPGMILFVPMIATVKIISNHSENLKPLGTLLGK